MRHCLILSIVADVSEEYAASIIRADTPAMLYQTIVSASYKQPEFDSTRFMNVPFSTASKRALELTQPSMLWITAALSPRIKRLGREADHPPPTSADVRII
jgi:hypothetical protein